MSSATLSLKALISAKGGQIEELFVQDCDVTFAALEPVEKLVDLLGNLWLDGYSTLPTEIETKLLSFQIESESIRTYNEFYYHSIFNVQTLANITPTLIRRLHEPAQQKTHTGVLQPLPPDVQAILRNSNSVETIAKTPPASLVPALDRASSMRQTTVQRTTSKPPHHGAGNARSQSREQNRSNMVSKNARSTGFAEASSRDTSISAHLVGHVAATPSDPYTKFTVDVQYWLSAEIMDAKSQKQAKDWAPRLFGRRSVYTPYLTVVMVDDRTADTNEYRYRLIAASSICLYQDHLLFKKKQEKQAQLSHVAGTKNPSEDRKKLETGNYHYGILMNELGFEVWSIRSLLSETTTWSGFTATPLVSDDLDSLQNIKTLLHWISSIHRWGATNHKARFQNDLDMLPRSNQAHRQSLVPY
ncbi:hypothetical protein MMC17_009360 [Xylographa soralifera]|nr:hypothetical protein [Xylographa soralifera]